jgi:hypothetical protein
MLKEGEEGEEGGKDTCKFNRGRKTISILR